MYIDSFSILLLSIEPRPVPLYLLPQNWARWTWLNSRGMLFGWAVNAAGHQYLQSASTQDGYTLTHSTGVQHSWPLFFLKTGYGITIDSKKNRKNGLMVTFEVTLFSEGKASLLLKHNAYEESDYWLPFERLHLDLWESQLAWINAKGEPQDNAYEKRKLPREDLEVYLFSK